MMRITVLWQNLKPCRTCLASPAPEKAGCEARLDPERIFPHVVKVVDQWANKKGDES